MELKYLVLDFDGTFTDVEREGEPFTRAFQELFADLLGRDDDLVRDVWRLAEKKVRDEQHRLGGFEENGKIVAPPSDPYLRATAVARILSQRFQVLRNPQLRSDVTQAVYRMAYRKAAATVFRAGAAEALDAMLAIDGVSVTIVTNAPAATVSEKLAKLALRGDARPVVLGDAFKLGVSSEPPLPIAPLPPERAAMLGAWRERWERVPSEATFAALARPIALRRGSYFRVLRDYVWKEDLSGPEKTLVVGDIYELDLALPAALGAHVELVTRESTPPHEVAIVEGLEHGHVCADLSGVVARVSALQAER